MFFQENKVQPAEKFLAGCDGQSDAGGSQAGQQDSAGEVPAVLQEYEAETSFKYQTDTEGAQASVLENVGYPSASILPQDTTAGGISLDQLTYSGDLVSDPEMDAAQSVPKAQATAAELSV